MKSQNLDATPSVEHTGLVGRHHVFDVYEGVLSSVALKHLQSLLDQVTDILPLMLAVVDAVSSVYWGEKNKGRHRGRVQCGLLLTVRSQSGLTKHHLWPRRIARRRIESANVIFPSDFKPNGRTESNSLLLCHGQWGLNGRRVFNCSAESLMRRPAEN